MLTMFEVGLSSLWLDVMWQVYIDCMLRQMLHCALLTSEYESSCRCRSARHASSQLRVLMPLLLISSLSVTTIAS